MRVPSHVDAAKYAPILCAGVTVFNSIRNMNIPPGATVGIQGLGGLGHLAIQYASKFGYRVVALSRDSKKEKFARQLGADEYVDASKGDTGEQLQKLGGASLIVATAPSADAISPLLKGLGILGKLLILSRMLALWRLMLVIEMLKIYASRGPGSRRYCYYGAIEMLKKNQQRIANISADPLWAFGPSLAQWSCH